MVAISLLKSTMPSVFSKKKSVLATSSKLVNKSIPSPSLVVVVSKVLSTDGVSPDFHVRLDVVTERLVVSAHGIQLTSNTLADVLCKWVTSIVLTQTS